MKVTQGTFSFLPPLTDEQIRKQVQYALDNGWPISIEYTDDPHPRNAYWEMYGLPMFDVKDAAGIMGQIRKARESTPTSTSRSTPTTRGWGGRRRRSRSS
jgi:ribulose-bisphosphate carboxylase small chain